jgi:glycosyltransferase involved in cell wall biosynthesis
LEKEGHLERVFTSLPWRYADEESRKQGLPRSKISCNFFWHGVQRLLTMLPLRSHKLHQALSVIDTKTYSRWVAARLPLCDAYIGISGTGLHAGRVARRRGSGYIMDRGSTHVRHANSLLGDEYKRWNLPWLPIHPWLMDNEDAEAAEADLITVPSDFVARTFVEQGVPGEKLRVVPYGVSLSEFFPCAVPAEDLFRLVFVGQFSLRKGAPYLLQAFKDFKHPHKELVVVGSVPDEMRSVIASIGVEHVRFTGIVPRSEVKQHLSSAHAMVLPSLEEGLALVQGQAMACGCPVISTPNAGAENLFDDQIEGLIVPPRDTRALTRAFEMLAANPEVRWRMSSAALGRIQRLAGWATYAKRMVAVASEAQVLARRSGPIF